MTSRDERRAKESFAKRHVKGASDPIHAMMESTAELLRDAAALMGEEIDDVPREHQAVAVLMQAGLAVAWARQFYQQVLDSATSPETRSFAASKIEKYAETFESRFTPDEAPPPQSLIALS